MKVLHLVFLSFLLPFSASAKVKLKDFEFYPGKEYAKVKIRFIGNLSAEPVFSVKKNMLQIEITDAQVWPRIEKRVTVGEPSFDTRMMLYQYDKDTTRFRVLFPFATAELENNFKVVKKKGYIVLKFPVKRAIKPVAKTDEKASKLDEEYLKKLLTQTRPAPQKDTIKTTLSSIQKAGSDFSLLPYIGKFGAFLVVVLLLFLGVVAIFKKGMLKKGKLGLLNKMKPVEVLSTTYLGPKKSLLLIKAHNQVILLGSSETGINFLTEVDGTTDLMKKGEAHISGKNFDTTLLKEEGSKKEFKLKEDVETSPNDENEKMSEQIKNKLQNLKSFQQVNDV